MNLAVRLKTEWWIIAALVSLLAVILTLGNALSRLDNAAYDQLLHLDPPRPDGRIALVEIDDAALAQFGRWPWDRSVHAQLVDRLREGAPQAIVYDTLFTEPGTVQGDAALAGAMVHAGNVFLPFFIGAGAKVVEPIAPLRDAARGTGFTDFLVDPDGVMRSAPAPLGSRLHLMDDVHGSLGASAPVPGAGRLIPFTSGEQWPRLSAASLLAGKGPGAALRGKVVLVGVTAAGIGPRYPVPGHGTMSGLEINAQFLHGLLGNLMIAKAGSAARIGFALVPVWLLMLLMGPFPRFSPALGLAVGTVGILVLSGLLLLLGRVWLPPATPILALCVAYPIWGWRQLAITQQFMHGELLRLAADSTIFTPPAGQGRQPLPSTIALLTAAIASNRDMKRFVAERLDQLPDATLVTDGEGDILLASASAGRLFGPEHVRGDEPGKGGALLTRFRQAGSQKPIRFPVAPTAAPLSFDAITEDGHFFTIRFAPQLAAGGGFVGWIVQFMDVSEAKAAQRQRDDILELLTHDMRSPQASILAVLETAPSENIAPEEARRIRHYAERTLGLADGFVQLARAESLEYALEDVALGDMMIDAIDDLWPQLTAKSISIETCGEDERLIVRVERSLVTRALINLLDNAIKHSRAGSHIRCTVGQEPDGEPRAFCAISDEGPGLEEAHRHRLFERFHRGPLGAGRRMDGVGLGLSFVHTVVVRHRGEVRCLSEVGRGATFSLILPLADRAPS